MNTPRELLFARHQHVAPRLDAIRRNLVEDISLGRPATSDPQTSGFPVSSCLTRLWQELIWPSRRAWATIAVLWAGVLVWNVAEADSAPRSERLRAGAASEMVQNLTAQRHLLSELLEPAPQREPEPARPNTQPRTAVIPGFKFC